MDVFLKTQSSLYERLLELAKKCRDDSLTLNDAINYRTEYVAVCKRMKSINKLLEEEIVSAEKRVQEHINLLTSTPRSVMQLVWDATGKK
jgi:hypothetical protein